RPRWSVAMAVSMWRATGCPILEVIDHVVTPVRATSLGLNTLKEICDALCRWFRAGRAEGQDRRLQGPGTQGLRGLDGIWRPRLCRMHRRRRSLWRVDLVSARGDGERG